MARHSFLLSIILFCLCIPSNSGLSGQTLPDTLAASIQNLNKNEQIEYLSSLGWKLRESNVDQAVLLTENAFELALAEENRHQIARIGNFLGAIYLHYLFDHNKAIAPLHKALENASIIRDTTQIAYAYNNLGDAYFLSDNIPMAKEFAEHSLKYFEAIGDRKGIAYSFVNHGLIARYEKKPDHAIRFFEKADSLASELNDVRRMAYCQLEIANTKLLQKKYDEAIVLYKKSYEQHYSQKNINYSALCAKGIADTYFQLNEFEKSLEYYLIASDLNSTRHNKFNRIDILSGLGKLYGKTGKVEEGELLLEEALNLAINLNVGSKIKNCFNAMGEFYRNIGDYKTAADKSIEYINLADSLYKTLQAKVLRESTERVNSKLRILDYESDAKQRKKKLAYLLTISLLLSVLIVVLVVNLLRRSESNKQLRLMNESKDKLFSIISHDLKNPFVALHQYIDLLKDGEMTDTMKEWFINDLDQKATATQNLLENLLNLSASRTGKLSFNPTEIGSIDLVQDLLKQAKTQLDQKHITVELDLDGNTIFADRNMLNLSLRNLLSNAIKFSPENGKVAISSNTNDQGTTLSIRDFGIGMDKKTVDGLFQSDFTNSKVGTAGEKGTGIGLSLCKEFIDKHNGIIKVTSEKNTGSVFRIFLPSV